VNIDVDATMIRGHVADFVDLIAADGNASDVQGETVPSQSKPFLRTTSKLGLRLQEASGTEIASRSIVRRIVA
jgi:hypothetical protein